MIELQPRQGISEMDFGYNAKSGGYANLSSDITELSAIVVKNMNDRYKHLVISKSISIETESSLSMERMFGNRRGYCL